MLKRVASVPYPIPRAPKRQRRTATAVLAAYFDPRPLRDYFTDMANSNSDSDAHQSPYNSIVGRGPGILFDIRPQDEKDREIAQERKRLLKNAKRRERDLEKRKEKEDNWFKKIQRRVERAQHTTDDATSDNRADDAQRVAPPPLTTGVTDDRVAQLPSGGHIGTPHASSTNYTSSGDGAAHLSHLHTNPSAGSASGSGWCHWSPRHGYAAPVTEATSTHTFTNTDMSSAPPSRVAFTYDASYTARTTRPVSDLVQPHHVGGNRASGVGGVTLDVSMASLPLSSPSTALASPPTPSHSISSITSRTSSKRPHTPADDEDELMHDMMTTPSHVQGHAHRGGGVHGADFDDTYSPLDMGDEESQLVLEHNNNHNTPVKASSVFDCKKTVPIVHAHADTASPSPCTAFTPTRVAPHFDTPMVSPRRTHGREAHSGVGSTPRTPMDRGTHARSAAGSPYASPAAGRFLPQPQSPAQVPYTPVTAHAQRPSATLGTGYPMSYSGSNTGSPSSVATFHQHQNVQPTPSPVTPSSTAHRRNALSVAALLSPPSPVWSYTNTPDRSVPLAPIAEVPDHASICDSSTPALHQGRVEAADGAGDGLGDQIPEPSVGASSTVEESCLSPMMGMASPSLLSGERVLLAASVPKLGEAQSLDAAMMDIVRGNEAVMRGESGKETRGGFAAPEEKTTAPTVLGPAIQLEGREGGSGYGSLKNLGMWKGARENSESATPEPGREARKWGRASKAMLILQSEDELTEMDEFDGGDEEEVDELADDDDDEDFELMAPRGRRSLGGVSKKGKGKGKGKGVKGGRKGAKGRGRGMSMTGSGGLLSVRGQTTLPAAMTVVSSIGVAESSTAHVNVNDNVAAGITPAVTTETTDGTPTITDDAANISGAANPKKRKRQAVKKGWKGWAVVDIGDVDEEEEMRRLAPKQFRMEELLVRERRTRSGKQFDA